MSNHPTTPPEGRESGPQPLSAGDRKELVAYREGVGLFHIEYSPITAAVTNVIRTEGIHAVSVHRGDWHKYLTVEAMEEVQRLSKKANRSD